MNATSSQLLALSPVSSTPLSSKAASSTAKRNSGSQTPNTSSAFHSSAISSNSITTAPSPAIHAIPTPKRGVKNKKTSNPSGANPTSVTGPSNKRRCVSNACIACRKRKSKCDGNHPSCAACASVYGTDCIYDPSSDHRRKGVYKKDIDNLKTRNSTLQTLIQAILDYPEDQVGGLVNAIRSSDNLEEVAEAIAEGGKYGLGPVRLPASAGRISQGDNGAAEGVNGAGIEQSWNTVDSDRPSIMCDDEPPSTPFGNQATFESELSHRMSQLRVDLESGQVRFIGGTSNLILVPSHQERQKDGFDNRSRGTSPMEFGLQGALSDPYASSRERNPLLSWTTVINEGKVIQHLVNMYFAWHYPYFTTLSRDLFYQDFYAGYTALQSNVSRYPHSSPSPPMYSSAGSPSAQAAQAPQAKFCTPLLVNAILALGCHFTSHPLARADQLNANSVGDHFFKECKKLLLENDEHATPRLATVQALALMSVREAGCAREEKGWSYSGMSFRMGIEMGLHLELEAKDGDKSGEDGNRSRSAISDGEIDARRITFWGCYLFDKCWSNYMGRMPQFQSSIISVPKFIVIPSEDAANWCPYTDVGESFTSSQPARTRSVALHISELCEISSDILTSFYNPNPNTHKPKASGSASGLRTGQEQKIEIRKLGEIWNRLEDWKRRLPKELEGREGSLPPVLLMHMFHQLLYIHLFRPFLKYSPTTLLASTNLEPRKICVQAASTISKYLRFYRREYGLRQICNIAAYIVHSACTIHLLNLPAKTAKRDIVQGLRSLEDMAEGWLCARRALVIMRVLAKRWKIELPDEAVVILTRAAKGWAEMFGLQEVVDEDGEDYLQYRGSSLSAVSPSEEIGHSPLLYTGVRQSNLNMLGADASMEETEDSSSPSLHGSPSLAPVPGLQTQTQPVTNQFPSQLQLPNAAQGNSHHRSVYQQAQPYHRRQSQPSKQRRQSGPNILPHHQIINTSYAQQRYHTYLDISNPTSAVPPPTSTTSSQSFATPMVPNLSTMTVASSCASEHLQHHTHLSHHAHQQHNYYAAPINAPSPMDSHHSNASSASSPAPSISNFPNMSVPMTNAISIGYEAGTNMSGDQWWLRDQSNLVREFGVVDGWLGGTSPVNEETGGMSIGQADSPSSTHSGKTAGGGGFVNAGGGFDFGEGRF